MNTFSVNRAVIRTSCFYQTQESTVDNIFFAVRVVRIWNSLPEDIVSADRLSLFVRLLNRVNLSEFLIGKS